MTHTKADDPVKIQLGRKVEFPVGTPLAPLDNAYHEGIYIGL